MTVSASSTTVTLIITTNGIDEQQRGKTEKYVKFMWYDAFIIQQHEATLDRNMNILIKFDLVNKEE